MLAEASVTTSPTVKTALILQSMFCRALFSIVKDFHSTSLCQEPPNQRYSQWSFPSNDNIGFKLYTLENHTGHRPLQQGFGKKWRTAPSKNCQPTIGQLSFTILCELFSPTVGKLSPDSWQHVGNVSTKCRLRTIVCTTLFVAQIAHYINIALQRRKIVCLNAKTSVFINNWGQLLTQKLSPPFCLGFWR